MSSLKPNLSSAQVQPDLREGICWAVLGQLPRQHQFRPQLVNSWLGRADPACLDCRLTVFTQRCNRHICRQEILLAEVPSLLSETPGVGG